MLEADLLFGTTWNGVGVKQSCRKNVVTYAIKDDRMLSSVGLDVMLNRTVLRHWEN